MAAKREACVPAWDIAVNDYNPLGPTMCKDTPDFLLFSALLFKIYPFNGPQTFSLA